VRLFRRKPRLHRGIVDEDVQAMLGRPAEAPSEAKLAELREVAGSHPSLRAVYLTQRLVVTADEEPTILLGLLVDDGADYAAIARDIGDRVHPIRPGDRSLDFELLEDEPADDFWERVY
jgi:hypothetical protein